MSVSGLLVVCSTKMLFMSKMAGVKSSSPLSGDKASPVSTRLRGLVVLKLAVIGMLFLHNPA